jgi:hypothetical protein
MAKGSAFFRNMEWKVGVQIKGVSITCCILHMDWLTGKYQNMSTTSHSHWTLKFILRHMLGD